MAFDPEYVAAVEREQQRLIWEEIARLRKANYKRAWQALKRKGDLQSHRRKADSRTPRITYAAHKARHDTLTA